LACLSSPQTTTWLAFATASPSINVLLLKGNICKMLLNDENDFHAKNNKNHTKIHKKKY